MINRTFVETKLSYIQTYYEELEERPNRLNRPNRPVMGCVPNSLRL
jgi:hypothetical protein